MLPRFSTGPSDPLRYAEVIGDPIAQSKSPLIHKHWLGLCKVEGDYRRTFVERGRLEEFLAERRLDPLWRGCNVTIPHKEQAAALVDELDQRARAIGAVNCIVASPAGLTGANTDVDGIAAALDSIALDGASAAIIGGGGGARAAVAYLAGRSVAEIIVLVRDPAKAESLRTVAPATSMEIDYLDRAGPKLERVSAVINATQLGMRGCAEMPADLLAAITRQAGGATLLDMVYDPIETRFLATGRVAGAQVVDGLTMLVGQAAKAFEMFFGEPAPAPDEALRVLLTTGDLCDNSSPGD